MRDLSFNPSSSLNPDSESGFKDFLRIERYYSFKQRRVRKIAEISRAVAFSDYGKI